jgi:hypothetical protein
MAGLLTYSVFERLPVGLWTVSGKSIVQNVYEFTAAGLLPILTAFPFNRFPWTSNERTNASAKIG